MANTDNVTTVIIKRDSGNALGIASFIFGLISIFVFAPVFVPLALLLGIIAVLKKQIVWGVLGLVCSVIGAMTSPILLGLLGFATVGSVIDVPAQRTVSPVTQFTNRQNYANGNAVQHQAETTHNPQPRTNADDINAGSARKNGDAEASLPPIMHDSDKSMSHGSKSDIVGVWRGEYICGQGVTGLTLDIRNVQGVLNGIFKFYPTERSQGHVKSGAFELKGEFSDDGAFVFVPGEWLERPAGYYSVGMLGHLNKNKNEYSGVITDSGCSSFSVIRAVN